MALTMIRATLGPIWSFVGAVSVAGLVVIGVALAALPATPHPVGWLVIGALALVAGSFALKVPGVPVYLSISDTFFITSVLLFGPAPATVTIALDSFIMSWRRKNSWRQILFNATSNAVSLWLAGRVFFALASIGPLSDAPASPGVSLILPLMALAGVYFLLNSGLIATAVAQDKGLNPWTIWRKHFAVVSLNYFAAASTSFLLIGVMGSVSPLAVGAVVPLLIVGYLSMRSWLGRLDDAQLHIARINRLYLSTVSALSTAIEAKDGVTSDHIHRVQAYALGLARALDITDPPTLQAIEAAALLHDTGKLAIPEHILNKPGRLTAAEFETMKSHVEVGAEILSSIEFPYPVVPIVRAHHENWDGTGYPQGLSGQAIPIGARILSVVDCFDALTSDRPYRPAMSEREAFDIIRERRGSMYDPDVVDAFIRTYKEMVVPTPRPQLQAAAREVWRASSTAAPVAPLEQAATGSAPSNPLLAVVSLARLAAGTSSLRDVGILAAAHLEQLAPGATIGLFALDSNKTRLTAQYATGPSSERVTGLTMAVGERVSGWVAANARPMVNSVARLDLGDEAGESLRYALALPLVVDGSVVGVMTWYGPDPFSEDQSRSLEMIAPHLATAVATTQAVKPVAAGADSDRRTRSGLRVVARR